MVKAALAILFRWLAVVSMSIWLGGFTFYGSFVIPILHDTMGGHEAGLVTGEVTNPLNAIGVATVVLWWVMVVVERSTGGWAAMARVGLLIGSTAILAGLIGLHPVMDSRIESGSMSRFYPLHKVYLNASTVQWVVNLGLIATSLLVWRIADRGPDRSTIKYAPTHPSPVPRLP